MRVTLVSTSSCMCSRRASVIMEKKATKMLRQRFYATRRALQNTKDSVFLPIQHGPYRVILRFLQLIFPAPLEQTGLRAVLPQVVVASLKHVFSLKENLEVSSRDSFARKVQLNSVSPTAKVRHRKSTSAMCTSPESSGKELQKL